MDSIDNITCPECGLDSAGLVSVDDGAEFILSCTHCDMKLSGETFGDLAHKYLNTQSEHNNNDDEGDY